MLRPCMDWYHRVVRELQFKSYSSNTGPSNTLSLEGLPDPWLLLRVFLTTLHPHSPFQSKCTSEPGSCSDNSRQLVLDDLGAWSSACKSTGSLNSCVYPEQGVVLTLFHFIITESSFTKCHTY